MKSASSSHPRPGPLGQREQPVLERWAVDDEVPEDRVAGRREGLHERAARDRGQEMAPQVGLFVMRQLDVEGGRQRSDPSPLGGSATPGSIVVRDVDGAHRHQLPHAHAGMLALAGRDGHVAAHADIAQRSGISVPAGRLLEPAQLDALGTGHAQERQCLGHGVALVGVHDEQESLAGVATCAHQPRHVLLGRLAPDLELHAHHAVLAAEEVDLVLDFPRRRRNHRLARSSHRCRSSASGRGSRPRGARAAGPRPCRRHPRWRCRRRPWPAWRTSAAAAGRT